MNILFKEKVQKLASFFQAVYNIVSQIPEGKVATYGQIAALLGHPRNAKIVGWAMRSAPKQLALPCHRVVNKSGAMAPDYVFGSAESQRVKLASEGITFTKDGFIDLTQHLWQINIKLSTED
jgi:methylated-DNA-protein-cysteine methyltransferase related protein